MKYKRDDVIDVVNLSLGHTMVIFRDGKAYCSCGQRLNW